MVCAHLFPFEQREAVGGEQAPNLGGIPVHNLLEHRHENAHRVGAENSTPGNARDEFGLTDGDSGAILLADMHHDRQIGVPCR